MEVKIITGPALSGKTYYATKRAKPEDKIIDIGTIVRQLSKTLSRVFDASLDEAICNEVFVRLDDIYSSNKEAVVYIVGPRQLTVIQKIEHYVKQILEEQLSIVFLQVPLSVLKQRFELRGEVKDQNITFKELVEKETELGLNEILKYIALNPQYTIIATYEGN